MTGQVLIGEADGHSLVLGLAQPGALPSIRQTFPCATEDELIAAIGDFVFEAGVVSLSCAAFCAPGPVMH